MDKKLPGKLPMKFLALMTVSVFALVCLAGCSSKGVQTLRSGTDKAKHLIMWKFKSNKEDYMIYDWVKQWNDANPEVQVDLELIPYNDYLTNKLPTAFATNSAPDIYQISAGGFLKYARAGCMLPLDSYMDSGLKKDLYPQSLNAVTYKGRILGIPIEREPVALFYNKKVLKEKGLPLPGDWDSLVNTAKALNSDRMSGIFIPSEADDYQNFIFYSFLFQVGDVFDSSTGTSEFAASGARALTLWRELTKYNCNIDTMIQSPSDIYPLTSGKTAMQICGYWAVKTLEKYYPDFEYGAVPLPHTADGKNTSVYGGWYQVVNSQSRYPADAARFNVWMWGEGVQRPLEWCTEASSKFPARKSVLEKNPQAFDNDKSSLFNGEILSRAIPEPRYPVEISNAVSKAIQDTMFSDKSIDEIARTADDTISNYLKENEGGL